jgi:release factor glutamine methyltransferase
MTCTISDAVRSGAARLARSGVPDPQRDARWLMAAALRVPRAALLSAANDRVDDAALAAFRGMIEARCRRQPVSQITGRREFWGREFLVTGDVLDPRPETETLVELALECSPTPGRLLDLGTGSGVLIVTLLAEIAGSTGIAVDIDRAALQVAAANAARHGVEQRVTFRLSDWASAVDGQFDLIVANPPYVPAKAVAYLDPEVRDWEPRHALTAGPSGLEAYERIACDLDRLMARHGTALFEIGFDQGSSVATVFRKIGCGAVAVHRDLQGRNRVVSVRRD